MFDLCPTPTILAVCSLSVFHYIFPFLPPSTKSKPLSLLSVMAVDLVKLPVMEDQRAIQDAATAGLQSMQHLIKIMSSSNNLGTTAANTQQQLTDFTVFKFKQVISLLNRTGHARFRRGPINKIPTPEHGRPAVAKAPISLDLNMEVDPKIEIAPTTLTRTVKECSGSISRQLLSTTSSSFFSTVTGDSSVSNGSSFFMTPNPAPTFSAGKPPLSSGHRKNCHGHALSAGKMTSSSSGPCHCSKRRYKP